MSKLLVWSLVLLIALPGLGVTAQEPPAASWCVSVWYPSSEHPGGYDSLLANLDVIDEVNPFWYQPNPDGSLSPINDAGDAEKLAAWRAAGLRILPTVVTFGGSAAIATPDLRAAHVAAIVALVEAQAYDGIDIDYESFAPETRDDFSAFIEELAAALHAHDRRLSVTVHAKTANASTWWPGAAAQDWPRLAPPVDIFRVMTYDYHSSVDEPGPIGPPAWASDVLAYAATVTDLSKVRLGLHFYGLNWPRRGRATTTTWEAVQRWVGSFGLEVQRDPADREAWVAIDVQGLPRQTIYVADATALAYKLDRIRAAYPDLGGVAIWGLGGEDPANWDVLRALETDCTLTGPAAP